MHLSARGEWRIRGERIDNDAIRDFIGRNYAADAQGRWFFQNGPQRVFVELEFTPWVYRVEPNGAVLTHTGVPPQRLRGAALIDDGRLVLDTELGCGVIDARDGAHVIRCVTDFAGLPLNERGIERWLEGRDETFAAATPLGLSGVPVRIERVTADALEKRFGFVRAPAPDETAVREPSE
ncbi:MAG TPA: DUF2946 family protein [Burkholderiaceae bacterium]|nr:DUF2946 family protein [Burkholderiaceae bacterium]